MHAIVLKSPYSQILAGCTVSFSGHAMSKYMKDGRRKSEEDVCLASKHVRSKLSVRKMEGERNNWKLGNTTGREMVLRISG